MLCVVIPQKITGQIIAESLQLSFGIFPDPHWEGDCRGQSSDCPSLLSLGHWCQLSSSHGRGSALMWEPVKLQGRLFSLSSFLPRSTAKQKGFWELNKEISAIKKNLGSFFSPSLHIKSNRKPCKVTCSPLSQLAVLYRASKKWKLQQSYQNTSILGLNKK